MKQRLTPLAVAAAYLGLTASPAAAGGKIVSPIYGAYDAECGSNIDCSFGTGLPVVTSGGNDYDSPSLFFVNNTPYDFTNGTVTLTGYQQQVLGYSATVTLPTIAAGTIYDLQWGAAPAVSGPNPSLFSYDYDDQFGNAAAGNPLCVQGNSYCTFVGNFNVAFAATANGAPISALFSPDNTQPFGNAAGKFVGFEGLNPDGLAETVYDDHSSSTPGVLAYVYTGTHGTQPSTPEPATWAMMLLGFGLTGAALRQQRASRSQTRHCAMI